MLPPGHEGPRAARDKGGTGLAWRGFGRLCRARQEGLLAAFLRGAAEGVSLDLNQAEVQTILRVIGSKAKLAGRTPLELKVDRSPVFHSKGRLGSGRAGRCFYYRLAPEDGWEDVSYRKALTEFRAQTAGSAKAGRQRQQQQKRRSPEGRLSDEQKRAFRAEVDDQIVQYKLQALRQCRGEGLGGQLVSDESGELLDFNGQAQVDHLVPFSDLLREFLESEGGRVPAVRRVPGTVSREFADRAYAQRWSRFHRRHAELQILSAAENNRKRKSAG